METCQKTPTECSDDPVETSEHDREVWITGVGLVSSIASGAATHWEVLSNGTASRNIDRSRFSPYCVHPLTDIRLESQIEKKSDVRQMGRWQQIGTYAAGLALDDALLKGKPELLSATDLIVAAGNGERDGIADAAVLRAVAASATAPNTLIAALQTSLRPTLYLAELSNLLAGNISIVHGVTRSSRTFKGEEQAGVAAFRDAVSRIRAGTSRLALVGGACNAERDDWLLSIELWGCLWCDDYATTRKRSAAGGGIVPGSLGAFVVVEEASHAMARGARPYARVGAIAAERNRLPPPLQVLRSAVPAGTTMRSLRHRIDVLSGAGGTQPAMQHELDWLDGLERAGLARSIRFSGDAVGHGMEAHFLAGVALAAIAMRHRQCYPRFADDDGPAIDSQLSIRTLVTSFGHWRGAGVALIEAVGVGE